MVYIKSSRKRFFSVHFMITERDLSWKKQTQVWTLKLLWFFPNRSVFCTEKSKSNIFFNANASPPKNKITRHSSMIHYFEIELFKSSSENSFSYRSCIVMNPLVQTFEGWREEQTIWISGRASPALCRWTSLSRAAGSSVWGRWREREDPRTPGWTSETQLLPADSPLDQEPELHKHTQNK